VTSLGLREAQAVLRGMEDRQDDVIAEYRRGVEANPSDPVAHLLLGRVYQSAGKIDAARTELETARRLGGVEGREERALGSVYLASHRPADARKALESYLARYPRSAWAHLMLGKALAEEGKEDDAAIEYRRALSLQPDYGEGHRALGLHLGRKGDEADGFYQLALAARERGDLQQAFNFFQRAKDELPEKDPRQPEIEAALEELKPFVADSRELGGRRRRPGGPPG
jgi:tetratricopeptide (TPR) repeat protein